MSHRRLIAAPIAAIAVTAALVAGCGSDDNGSNDSGTSSTSSVTASTPSSTGGTASTPTTPSSGGGASVGSPTLDDVLNGIHSVLLNQGLDPAVAKCVEDELRKSLTPEDVKDINGAAPPPGFQQKVADAAQACNPTGGG